jgi:hypothetical protein
MTFPGVIGRRACAALAVGSAGLHAAMLGQTGPATTALLAVMIAACLYCALDLWRDGTIRAWVVVALMNLAMIALHLPGPAHHHGAALTGPQDGPTLMAAATSLALIEAAVAAAVLYVRSRSQFERISGTPDR